MVDVTIKSGVYTKKELDKELLKFFDTQEDSDLFFEACMDTGQITKKDDRYILKSEKKIVTLGRPKIFDVSTYYYGGSRRAGVRGGSDWVEQQGFPSNMYISKAYIDGEWVDIKEKPQLPLVKGRGFDVDATVEKWRAQIPINIQRKYGIDIGTPLRVGVREETYDYYTGLKLWGYRYRVMLSYGETKKGQNPRNLELTAHGFVNKTSKDIKDTIMRDQKRVKTIGLAILGKADAEYYGLYMESLNAGRDTENIEVEALIKEAGFVPIVELLDLENRRKIFDAYTNVEKKVIPKINEFTINSNIDQGLAGIRGQTALNFRWRNKGGFK